MRTKWLFLFSFLSQFKCYPWTGGSLSGELQCEQEGEKRGTGTAAATAAALQPQHHRENTHTHTHTLCYTQLVSYTRRHMLQPHTAHTYMALTGTWGGASGLMDCLECVVWWGQAGVSAQSNLTKSSEEDKRAGQCPGETQNFSRRLGLFENPGKRQKNPVFAFGILLLLLFFFYSCRLIFMNFHPCIWEREIYW